MKNKLFLIVSLFAFLSVSVLSQNSEVNLRGQSIEQLSNTQIQRLLQEIERRGLSEDEAVEMALAYGIPSSQIPMIRQQIRARAYSNMMQQSTMSPTELYYGEDLLLLQEKPFFFATDEEKRVFGFHLFNSENLTFEPSVNIPVSPKYVIGPGDSFVIDIYGASQMQYSLPVDKNGNINIPQIGVINVGGLEMEIAEKRIFGKLSSIYRDLVSPYPRTYANINLDEIKSINVSVVGEAFVPGTYTLPGTATAFNALYYAGGPNYTGSFREIWIIRNGERIAELDVYDYLLNGNASVNIPLRDADVILIPTYKKRIRVEGEFIRTGIFESKENESYEQFIRFTGGFSENAYKKRIELYRNTGIEKEVIDLFADIFAQIETQSGDSLFAGEILERFSNRVAIEGAVFRPGNYELTENMSLRDLIEKADGIREDAFLERGLILRLNDDLTPANLSFNISDVISGKSNIILKREDIVTISAIDMMRENRTVNIYGSVLQFGEFPFRENMTLGDIIAIAGGFLESASESFIEITRRLSYEEAKVADERIAHLFQFSVSRNLSLNSKDAAFELKPFDQIYVRNAPGFVEKSHVFVGGEVNYPGTYGLTGRNERLSEIIKRSGGLTKEAYSLGAMLTRKVSLSPKEKRLRESIQDVMSESIFEERDTNAIMRLDFEVLGINLEKALKNPGGRDDIFLKDGDELIIPRKMQTVNTDGEVLNPLSLPYIENKRFKYYVNQSGGFGDRAMKRKSYVVYPNGTAAATHNFIFFRSYPEVKAGSQIIVPRKADRENIPASAWVAITGSLTSSLALILVAVIR
ncbi:MAG: SLBB domain-containing protein [Marinilabiliaceae bacterium]|nr:SLBB domain-containing protein [Marinilabiliaceae bacterium]